MKTKTSATTPRTSTPGDAPMDSTFILSTPKASKAEREMLKILQGGAGRGAEKNLAAIERFNRRSTRYEISPTYADPSPGRTDELLRKASEVGVEAYGIESRVEEAALGLAQGDKTPIVLQIDRASDIARTLAATRELQRIVFVYLLMKRAEGELAAVRMYLRPDRPEERSLAENFFARLGEITIPSGSGALLGEGADAADLAREPLFRAWFAEHLTKNLPKAVAGLESECAPFEITSDGRTTQTLHLVGHDAFADPIELATRVMRAPSSPIQKGRDFVLGEFAPEGVRFQTLRIRRTDGELSIRGTSVPDAATTERARALLADPAEGSAQEMGQGTAQPSDLAHVGSDLALAAAALAQVLAVTRANTLSATNPVQTTD